MRLDGSSMLGLKRARSRTLLARVLGLHTYPLILSFIFLSLTTLAKTNLAGDVTAFRWVSFSELEAFGPGDHRGPQAGRGGRWAQVGLFELFLIPLLLGKFKLSYFTENLSLSAT